MSLDVKCDKCGKEMEKKGGILYSTPMDGYALAIDGEVCQKRHLCQNCCRAVEEFIGVSDFIIPKCNCLTKTPDPQYHKEDCPVSLFAKSKSKISALKCAKFAIENSYLKNMRVFDPVAGKSTSIVQIINEALNDE